MAQYYIRSGADIYKLDATTTITQKHSGKATRNMVDNLSTLSDHYIDEPMSFSLSGVISSIKVRSNSSNKSPSDFIKGIVDLKNKRQLFTFYYNDDIGPVNNCVFTNISITQTKDNGFRRGLTSYVSSYAISADIEQLRVATAVSITSEPDPALADIVSSTEASSGSAESLSSGDGLPVNETRLEMGNRQLQESLSGVRKNAP